MRGCVSIRAIGAVLAAFWLCHPAAGQALAPEVLAMSRASRLVGESVSALENCVCLESVARARVDKKGKLKQNERDALQIEATTIGDREWFSWPGRDDVFVQDPSALVSFGLMDSGQLTSTLKTVFLGGFASRTFHGETAFQSRPAMQFDYAVRSVFTHFHLKMRGSSTDAGMKGSFWIDPQTGELLALSSEGTEIPPDFAIRSTRTEVIYAPMYLEDRRIVLPQTATTVVEDSTGVSSINRVEFSHCHPYATTSSIRFDDAPAPLPPPGPPVRHGQQPIPSGLALLMRFSTPLTAQAAVGERCALIMMADVGSNGEKVIEKGAPVEGRIRWIEQSHCPARCLVLSVELVSVMTTDGTRHPVYASLRQVVPEAKVSLSVSKVSQTLSELPLGQRIATSSLSIEIPEIPGVGSFFVLTPDLSTPPDFLMTWSTENPHRP